MNLSQVGPAECAERLNKVRQNNVRTEAQRPKYESRNGSKMDPNMEPNIIYYTGVDPKHNRDVTLRAGRAMGEAGGRAGGEAGGKAGGNSNFKAGQGWGEAGGKAGGNNNFKVGQDFGNSFQPGKNPIMLRMFGEHIPRRTTCAPLRHLAKPTGNSHELGSIFKCNWNVGSTHAHTQNGEKERQH